MTGTRKLFKRLPSWLRSLLFVVGIGAAFYLYEQTKTRIGGLWITLSVFGAIAILFAIGMIGTMRTTPPDEVLAQADEIDGEGGKSRQKAMRAILVAGFLICVALVAIVSFQIMPGTRSEKMGTFLFGMLLLIGGMAIPYIVIFGIFLFGFLLRPVHVGTEFRLLVDSGLPISLAPRADLHRVAEITEGISHAELLADGSGRYRLHAKGLLWRLIGMGQMQEICLAPDETNLSIRSATDSGDIETLAYRQSSDRYGIPILSCSFDATLRSPYMKALVRIVGPARMLEGGAKVEARRLSRLLGFGVRAEITEQFWRSARHV